MPFLRVLTKAGLLVLVTVSLAPLYLLVLLAAFPLRRRIGPPMLRFYSSLCLTILRVHVEKPMEGRALRGNRGGVLIVANHVSVLDIFVLSSSFGTVFVSKAEVRRYPVIGQIASLMGTVFLRRDSHRERFALIKTIAGTCTGRRIAVFPQGTTSRSAERLPFYRGLFKVIELNPELTILPVSLRYREEPDVVWEKPQSMADNFLKVCSRKNVQVSVIVHPAVRIDDYRGKSPAEVCRMVEEIVFSPLH